MMRVWSWGCARFDAEPQGRELQVAEVPPRSCVRRSLPCAFPCRCGGVGRPVSWLSPIKQKNRAPSEICSAHWLGSSGSRRDLRGLTGWGTPRPLLGAKRGNSAAHSTDLTGAFLLSPPAAMTRPSHLTHLHCHGDKSCPWSLARSQHRWLWRLLTGRCVWRTNPVHSHLCPQVSDTSYDWLTHRVPGVSLSAPTLQPPPVHSGPVWLPHTCGGFGI